MDYPLNLTKPAKGVVPAGFALANDADEHKALSAQGFEPAYVEPVKAKKADKD